MARSKVMTPSEQGIGRRSRWGGGYIFTGLTFTVLVSQDIHSVAHDWLHYLLESLALRHGTREVACRKPDGIF